MFIKIRPKSARGYTLVEVVVAMGVFSIVGMALATLFMFSVRTFASLVNYAELNRENRQAMDLMTREIRQAKEVTAYTTNSISLVNGDGLTVTYSFSPIGKQMVRDVSDGTHQVLLDDCSLLDFHLFQRNPIDGTYDVYPVATNDWEQTVKVVQLTWKTSRTLNPRSIINSEDVQTARIVIRKQHNNS